ncbi:thioesterase family protein [Pseudoxanthomonas sangjuensis]|uniref:acyl-CoA thioesterase n=1 Tax=Pseudoxanthomonas sangjuensis TaxID=1503750 RepID=UPI001391839A|nr:thioesterase family protein [Pseudoxanthomonas sangjuensis]KAF1715752.1 thioesterase [Pseudoxanthomonas sangjuensis]
MSSDNAPSAGSPKPLFRMPLQLRWSDLDAFNHVNNARYLTFLEEARIRWFDSIGEEWVTDEFAPVVVSVQLNYRQPIPYPADVVVELGVERVGTSSTTIAHRIVNADGRTLYNDGNVVAVWIDRKTGRPRPLPDSIRSAVGA